MIDALQEAIRNEISTKINKIPTETLKLDKSMFFGEFESNPESFQFSLGERIQLKEVAAFAKEKFEIHGPSYFSDKKKYNT